jgi:hypothetical protein
MTSLGNRRLVLDAGALLALARGDGATRATVKRALRQGYEVVVPTPVVTQVQRGGWDRASMARALKAVDSFVETSLETSMRAGVLLGRTGLADAVDAIVAAEAMTGACTTVVTIDPDDIGRLVEADEAGRRVYIEAI